MSKKNVTGEKYVKAKWYQLINWRSILMFGVLLVLAVVQGFVDTDVNYDSDVPEVSEIPEYSGSPYIEINGNVPVFGEVDQDLGFYEDYGDLDEYGRCTAAVACINERLMPTRERGDISSVKPTGWHSVQYDFVDGKSLYNRCHLIGHQLTGEDANEKNLITGTRYMNVEGMLPFENMVADYIKETGNKVLYRVTPIFVGNEAVARGVQMEAWSLEDGGEGICFNVYCYNVQPGVEIDYLTGESREAEFSCGHEPQDLVLNTASGKFHTPDCSGAADMNPDNRLDVSACPDEMIAKGYEPCGSCKPAA